jgi:hypothetical protein
MLIDREREADIFSIRICPEKSDKSAQLSDYFGQLCIDVGQKKWPPTV